LLNYIPFPFPDTFFSDTDNIHEQATEELIFRDIWFQLFMTGNAVETATLGCLLNKIINQFNAATQFRMQLFDEVILNLPAPYASNVQWTALPEGTKELLRCNYCALQLLGTAHALDTAISQLTHKVDEVLVLMNLEYLEIDVIDGIKTTLHLSPRALHRLHKRFTNSKIASHRWAHVNESFRQTQADTGNLTHFDELIMRSVSNNNHDDESYLAELMKAGRSQYHNNANEGAAKISHEANDTQSIVTELTSTVPTSAVPTSTTTSTTQQELSATDTTQDNPIHKDGQDTPLSDPKFVRIVQPPTNQDNNQYLPVNEAVAEAVRQYTAHLNAIVLEATETTTTTAAIPTATNDITASMVDAPCPVGAKEASSGLMTSTTPTRVLFKEPLEHSQGEQDQRTQSIQPQRIPEMTTLQPG
jgi:hypothetical protein